MDGLKSFFHLLFLPSSRGTIAIFSIMFLVVMAFSQASAQTQYSIGSPTNEQQYMLELINRARANATAEATRLGLSGPQEGPPSINGEAWTIPITVQPLSWNPLLLNSAQNHATNLNNNDQFFIQGSNPHTFGGTTPDGRIAAAGYVSAFPNQYNGPTTPSGSFPGAENVFEAVSQGSGPYTGAKLIAAVLEGHNALYVDQGVQGRGHRCTTTLGFFREIGIGMNAGSDNGQGVTWDSFYLVQNFGTLVNSTPFVTGVVFQDANGNGFYDPGEGIAGVRVDVAGSNFFAVTSSSGGYSVPVPGNGTFNVSFSGGGVATRQVTATVAGNLNAKVDYNAAGVTTPTVLANVSTRLRVETGDNILIGGFIVSGTQPKRVIVRGIGSSLTTFPDRLANPTLELRDAAGVLIRANDDWRVGGQEGEIIATGIPPSNDLESALIATLPANNAGYTAVVRGVNNGTGVAVVEAYDLDRTANSKLANIATRGFVQTGNNVLIAGTIILGQTAQKVIVRAIGPSLTNVPGKMADPTLELRDGNGTLVRANDNWRTGGQEAEIMGTGIPPSNDLESAIVATLPAAGASYTAIVSGVNNTTGIAVVEMYAIN